MNVCETTFNEEQIQQVMSIELDYSCYICFLVCTEVESESIYMVHYVKSAPALSLKKWFRCWRSVWMR